MKTCLLLFVSGLLFLNPVLAQKRLISGKVTMAADGAELPGVNIVVKGAGVGTATKADGTYQISVAATDTTLLFSMLGYTTQAVVVSNRDVVDVQLAEETNLLSEVVVSALGFRESSDELGSTNSRINGAQVVNSGETGVINALAGKASGVQIMQSSGDPGAGAFIQIRGISTITGNTQPLIVIDGTPISNTTEGGNAGGVVQQSRLNDINPNDIATMTILKGASAAALWGSRAANGVIVITTKKGAKGKLGISYSATYSIDQVNAYHKQQDKFGQGSQNKFTDGTAVPADRPGIGSIGVYDPNGTSAWGDRIADRSGAADQVNTTGQFFDAQNGTRYYPILQKNSRETFAQSNYDRVFRTGHSFNNALSLSGGDDKSTLFFSLDNLSQRGVLRGNSDYKRTTIRMNAERKFNEVVKLATSTSYISSFSNRQQRGNNLSAAPVGLLRTPADFDIRDYKGSYYESPAASPTLNRQRAYRSYLGASAAPANDNPIWALNEQTNTSAVSRFLGSIDLTIKPVSWFDLTARAGVDTYTDEQLNLFPVNDYVGSGNGQYTQQMTKERELNADLIGRAIKEFGQNFMLTYIVGFNVNDQKYYNLGLTATNFLVPDGPVNASNATAANRAPFNSNRRIRSARLYSTASFSAYDALFLNASVAAESASSFGELSKKTFYYPSADVAWQFSKLPFFEPGSILSFGKLRASYGVVGVRPLPYRTRTTFVAASFTNSPFVDNLVGSQYGNGAFLQNSEQGNEQLKPERKTEYEFGADLRLLKNRLKLSGTYYQNKVTDVLMPVTLAASTGFATKYTNAASLLNKGVELDLSYELIQSETFRWSINGNVNQNRNKVLSLAGTNSLVLNGIANFIDVRAVQDQPVGVFWAGKYARTETGALRLDANNFPGLDPVSGVIGNPNPKWRGGFGTSFSYKNLSLDVLFETSQGGDFYNGTESIMGNFGTSELTGHEVTLTQPLKNYAGVVVPAGSTVRGNMADFGGGPVLLDQSYYTGIGSGSSDLKEPFITDGSWTRLRQASLTYRLNSDWFRQKTKLQSVDFSVSGRNLILWTNVKGIDPDTNLTGAPFGRGLDYFNSPNTRSVLFAVRINY